ncbi:MAG: radical protein [Bacilli bacterium]|nr:radical protein [Bacilli bacterium]
MHLVYADRAGRIFDDSDLLPLGRSGMFLTEILSEELIPLPDGAALVSLPGTQAVGLDKETGGKVTLSDKYTAVGALAPQGYTRLLLPGYIKSAGNGPLPLMGYTAVVWDKGKFYIAAASTEADVNRFNPDLYPAMQQPVERLISRYPSNRIYQHLSTCSLEYGCLTSKNTFLGRWEGALPVSSTCNAGCVGCISEQPEDSPFPSPQVRMNFRPTVEEMTEVMIHHLQTGGPDAIISFGQGCEGEPSTRGLDIAEAIRRTRAVIESGYININTNAGLTPMIREIVRAGLDLMRVSIVSAIPEHYNAYYRPRAYTVEDVAESTKFASDHGVITSINYLIFPGVTDREEEIEAMVDFINDNGVRLIQLRNLNIDPELYLSQVPAQKGDVVGMKTMMEILQSECPGTQIGSYSHTPEDISSRVLG